MDRPSPKHGSVSGKDLSGCTLLVGSDAVLTDTRNTLHVVPEGSSRGSMGLKPSSGTFWMCRNAFQTGAQWHAQCMAKRGQGAQMQLPEVDCPQHRSAASSAVRELRLASTICSCTLNCCRGYQLPEQSGSPFEQSGSPPKLVDCQHAGPGKLRRWVTMCVSFNHTWCPHPADLRRRPH